jgi:hypothetical protein
MDFTDESRPRKDVVDAHRSLDLERSARPRHRGGLLSTELRHHLPWSAGGVLTGLALVWLLLNLVPGDSLSLTLQLFHLAHPTHLLLSAAATAAMVVVHGGGAWRAVGIGLVASAGVCTLSDIILPWIGGSALAGIDHMHWHLCVLEHPILVVPFLALGLAVGVLGGRRVERSTIYSHAGHVLVSALASLLYLTAFGLELSVSTLGPVLLILMAAVMLPCCVSDIVVPVLFGGPRCRHDD